MYRHQPVDQGASNPHVFHHSVSVPANMTGFVFHFLTLISLFVIQKQHVNIRIVELCIYAHT